MEEARHRYTGLAAIVVLWTSVGAATVIASDFGLFGERPLSYLVGERGPGALFAGGLLAGAVLLAAFHHWVRATYHPPRSFSVAMLVGLAGMVVTALVPVDGGPLARDVHVVAALTWAVSLPFLVGFFCAPRRRYGLLALELVSCGAGILLSALGVAAVAEIAPAVGFHTWILRVSTSVAPWPVSPSGLDIRPTPAC